MLKLSVTTGRGTRATIILSAASDTTVREAAAYLWSSDPSRAGAGALKDATLAVTPRSSGQGLAPRVVDPDVELAASGIRSGDHVEVVAASQADDVSAQAVATVTVVAGADVGRSYPLTVGSHVIGRDPHAAVPLSEPRASLRHARIVVGESIEVVDLGSTNGVILAGSFITRATLIPGDRVWIGDTALVISREPTAPEREVPTSPTVSFTRSPRVVPALPTDRVDLPPPPARLHERRFPAISLVAPVALGVAMYVATGRLISLLFVAMAPVMAVGTWWDARRVRRRELAAKSAEFDEVLGQVRAEVEARQRREREVRRERSPSTEAALAAAERLTPLVWSRRPEHDCFLQLRVGMGDAPSAITVELPGRVETYPGMWERLLAVRESSLTVKDVPIVVDLRSVGSLGIAGGGRAAAAVARGVVAQLACLHSPLELAVVAMVSPASAGDWAWLWWLPHTSPPESPLGVDHLADGHEASARLLAALERLVAARSGADIGDLVPTPRSAEASDHAHPPVLPAVVVVVEDDAAADRRRLIRLAERGPDVNVHLIWVASGASRIPAACRSFVELDDVGAGSVGQVRRGGFDAPVTLEPVTVERATEIARRLACIEDVSGVPRHGSDLPPSIPYLHLHGADAVEAQRHAQRWQGGARASAHASRPYSLRALVGHAGDAPFYLDLTTQGPHALVGGTTGSGKSEFLQSWVLAMAAAYGPDQVTFLYVDYKGGSAFAECVHLPHSVGIVTDLTPHLVERALASLRAELRYRERLLAEKGAKDLEALARTGDNDTPPSLVIVIDEFAALVREVPDFVDGVVDIAQRGRSLGLHLIMATQRPAGVVKDNLRANMNLRIALRMADEPDSVDVLGVRDAAHIDPSAPGRAFARTGPGRVTTFQAAYAGGHTTSDSAASPVAIEECGLGVRVPWVTLAPARSVGEEGESDAVRVVRAMREAHQELGLPAPRRPWLDPLAATYEVRDVVRACSRGIAFGIMDEPDVQAQSPAMFDPDAEGNMVFYGAPGSGKSTALRTVALAATLGSGGGPVHVYGVDSGSGGLDILQALPNVGDVVRLDDAERIARLMRTLARLIEVRAARFSTARASSLTEYRARAGAPHEARIVLLIDGLAPFQSAYMNEPGRDQAFRDFQVVLSEGRAVGVHVVASADRPGAVHSAVQAHLAKVVALRLVDETMYSFLGLKKSMVAPHSPAGRCVDPTRRREIQVAVLGASSAVAEQARHIEALASEVPAGATWVAPPVPRMPHLIDGGTLPADIGGCPVLGMEESSLEAIPLVLDRPLMVVGQGGSGRTTALAWLSYAVRRAHPRRRQVLLTLRRSALVGLSTWDHAATSVPAIADLLERMRQDFATPAEGDAALAVVIEAVNDFSGTAVDVALASALKELKRNGHFIVGEAETAGWTSGMVLGEVKSARRGILLQPEQQDGSLLMGVALPRMNRAAMPPGRAAFVENGRWSMVQIPLPGSELSTGSGLTLTQ